MLVFTFQNKIGSKDMHEKKLYVPVEIKVRDFYPKLLLSLEAANRGYKVFLGRRSKMEKNVKWINGGVFVNRGLNCVDNYLKRTLKLRKKGVLITSLDVEAGSVYDNPIAYKRMRIDRKVLTYVDHIFLWSKTEAQILKDEFGLDSEKFTITGNPIFDLASPSVKLQTREVSREIEKRSPYILVNLSTFMNDPLDKSTRKKNNKKFIRGMRSNFATKEEIEAWFAKFVQRRKDNNRLLKDVKKLANRNPNFNFIIRPHPSEPIEAFKQSYDFPQNCYIRRYGPVGPWIDYSKAMIHCNCTTAIESVIRGKIPVCHDPAGENPENLFHKNISINSYGVRDLEKIIFNEDRTSLIAEKKNLVEEELGGVKLLNSHKNIMDVIDCLLEQHAFSKTYFSITKTKFWEKICFIKEMLFLKIREILNRPKWVKVEEVEADIESLGWQASKFSIKEVANGIFKIELKSRSS